MFKRKLSLMTLPSGSMKLEVDGKGKKAMGKELTQRSDDQIYTTNEVAEMLKITPKAVREWIGRGELDAIDLGQGYRILQRDLDAFIEKRRISNRKKRKQADSQEDSSPPSGNA